VQPFRILLVEDFEPFRQFVRLALQPRADFKIVGEAVDGLEAVQKAKELQPDVILLDIGLPRLNGMAAAEQIRVLAPQSKLLFISLESSSAVVEEAFRLGARGYLHKLRAESDLIPAIETVLAGRQFLSGNLEPVESMKAPPCHEIQFYYDEAVILDSAIRFIGDALNANGTVVVVATAQHLESIVQRLKAEGRDMDRAIQQGTYISLNATEVLSKIIVNGRVNHACTSQVLTSVLESAIESAKRTNSRVSVFGECAGLLFAEGNATAAMELEKRANNLIAKSGIDILCPYPLHALQAPADEHTLKDVCAEHTAVFSK
jgi:CheY-like chemotaxis protein